MAIPTTDTQPSLLSAATAPHPGRISTIVGVAKSGGTPLGAAATTTTRAEDSDRQETCTLLDNALSDGEISMAEHRQRVSAATRAVTLGDLPALVADLQTDAAPPRVSFAKSPPASAKMVGWGAVAAILVGSLLLGVGIGWGLYGDTASPLDFTTDPGAKPDGVGPAVLTPPTQLHSVGGLTGLMEQTRKRFGNTTGFRLVVYPTYAVLDRADPPMTAGCSRTTTGVDGVTCGNPTSKPPIWSSSPHRTRLLRERFRCRFTTRVTTAAVSSSSQVTAPPNGSICRPSRVSRTRRGG